MQFWRFDNHAWCSWSLTATFACRNLVLHIVCKTILFQSIQACYLIIVLNKTRNIGSGSYRVSKMLTQFNYTAKHEFGSQYFPDLSTLLFIRVTQTHTRTRTRTHTHTHTHTTCLNITWLRFMVKYSSAGRHFINVLPHTNLHIFVWISPAYPQSS